MKLIITDEINQDVAFDTVVMSSSEFNNICSHPYIASSKFDAIVVDLRCKIRQGFLSQVAKTTLVIPKITEELNSHSISILTELYKERSAELRYNFMKDKERLKDIVSEMAAEFCWHEFY